jgi:chloramphenicol 3-O-phosphotransferase
MSVPAWLTEPTLRGPDETEQEWFLRVLGFVPKPTTQPSATVDPKRARRRRAVVSLERSIPPAYRECHFDTPTLSSRVCGAAIGIGRSSCDQPRVVLMGTARAGKTSLGVAMLWHSVTTTEREAVFVHAHRLGLARIQHPAGAGEPEVVATAMRTPLVLLDDVGSERDHAMNAVPDVLLERDAENLGVSRHTLFKLVRLQGIFVYRVGAQTLVPLGEIKDKLVPVWEAICLAEQNRKRDDSSENGARTSNAGGSAPHR